MLRSISVARLAAQAATHDTTPLSRTLHRLPLRARPLVPSHQSPVAGTIGPQWRGYATRGRPKAGKATTSTRSRAKTPAKTTRRKASTQSAKTKKKAVAKPKRKVPTEKQKAAAAKRKEREELKELKDTALMATEPRKKPESAYKVFVTQNIPKGTKASEHLKETAAKFKTLSAAELEQLNHAANENKTSNETAYRDWVEQHTPEQIRLANTARTTLRRKLSNGKSSRTRSGHGFSAIKDDRQVKRPTNAFFKFNTERQSSGDLKNIKISEAARLVKGEWDALSAGEKKKYEDLALADKQRYAREFNTIYGHPPPMARVNGARATA